MLSPGSSMEEPNLVWFGEPLKQLHCLHEVCIIWVDVLYVITVRLFHRITFLKSVFLGICLYFYTHLNKGIKGIDETVTSESN